MQTMSQQRAFKIRPIQPPASPRTDRISANLKRLTITVARLLSLLEQESGYRTSASVRSAIERLENTARELTSTLADETKSEGQEPGESE